MLASSAGNAVEVREAVQFLTGEYRNPRLLDVTMALCVEMLISGNPAKDDAEARAKLQTVLDNGKAAEILVAWWRRKRPDRFRRKLCEVPADGNAQQSGIC